MGSPQSVLRRDRELVWSRSPPAVEEVVPADFRLYDRSSPRVIAGRDGYRQYVAAHRSALPDMTAEVNAAFSGENWVASLTTIEGTFRSSFMGVRPTGERVAVEVPFVAAVHGDRIVRAATPGWAAFADGLRDGDDRNIPAGSVRDTVR